jgi:hypothetical protein
MVGHPRLIRTVSTLPVKVADTDCITVIDAR